MGKEKYYFDSDTLSYKRVVKSRTLQVSNFILFLLSAMLFGVFSLFILLNSEFISTPKAKNIVEAVQKVCYKEF